MPSDRQCKHECHQQMHEMVETVAPLTEKVRHQLLVTGRTGSSCRKSSAAELIRCEGGLDYSRRFHLLWLPDCSGPKTELTADCRGAPSRGLGMDTPASDRFAQGRSGDRTARSPSPLQRSRPECSRLRYRSERVSSLTLAEHRYEWSQPRCAGEGALWQLSERNSERRTAGAAHRDWDGEAGA
jgi:hypothetical protein